MLILAFQKGELTTHSKQPPGFKKGVFSVKKASGCFLVLLASAGLYLGWVSYPPNRYEAQAKELRTRVAEREQQWQKNVNDPEKNAYIDPTFLPYWGRKGLEQDNQNKVSKMAATADDYCYLAGGKDPTVLSKAMQEKPQEVARAFAGLEALYPDFRRAASRSEFSYSLNGPMTTQTLIPNLLAIRYLLSRLTGYAEYLALAGKPEQASEVIETILQFCSLLGKQPMSVIQMATVVRHQELAYEGLIRILENSPRRLKAAHLKDLAERITNSILPQSAFVEALENEFYILDNSVELAFADRLILSDTYLLAGKLPGVQARERRLLHNGFFEHLPEIRAGNSPDLNWVANFGFVDWASGQRGALAASLLPDWNKVQHLVKTSRIRSEFVHLYLSLYAQALQDGRWPVDLKSFLASGYQPIEPLKPEELSYQVKGKSMELKLSGYANKATQPGAERLSMARFGAVGGDWVLNAHL